MRVALDAGSGSGAKAAERFPGWEIVRLDANPDVRPDVVGDVRKIPLPDETVDGVFSAHVLEHLYEHEVPVALAEFRRVLRPGGALTLHVPDLRSVARKITDGALTDELYTADAGLVRPLDVLYGFQPYVREQPLYAHRTGFDGPTLAAALGAAGFIGDVTEMPDIYELRAEARKPRRGDRDSVRDVTAAVG